MTDVVALHPDREIDQILADVRDAMTRRSYPQARVAREAGISPATLTQVLGGTYAADARRVAAKLDQWLQRLRQDDTQPVMPVAPAWVSTPTSERVLAAMAYAHMAGDIAMVYGAPGAGKTTAAREYQRRYPSVWIATMSPATSGVTTALEEVCLALGMRELPQGAARMQRAIIAHVRDTRGVIVCDEAQHLSVQAIDALRAIHDATAIAFVFVGNELLAARMTGGTRAPWLAQLHSRVGRPVRLSRATAADVVAIAREYGVTDAAPVKRLQAIGAQAGALRAVVKTLRLASVMAAGTGAALSDSYIEQAWRELAGATGGEP